VTAPSSDRTRSDIVASLATTAWDLVVIGGGITGAGILREAVRRGHKALLLERRDFAWGTSSRSSKLVHGGLRYLKEGKVSLTWESVRERERLMAEGPGLVEPLGFLLANYKGDKTPPLLFGIGLTLYDLLAATSRKEASGLAHHRHYGADELRRLAPRLSADGLLGGFHYQDAGTDDARLVLRVLAEAEASGGTVLNYASAAGLLQAKGVAAGVAVRDEATGQTHEVKAKAVINATGVWVDALRKEAGGAPRMRPLRGSHLVVPQAKLPVIHALSVLHPDDGRPVFVFPWEGVTVIGTTDVDHRQDLEDEPAIDAAEVAYLMEIVDRRFPSAGLKRSDVIATYSGVRPVVGSGKKDPSKESRDHVIWNEQGLVTVTGGKLTTFGIIAHDALKAVASRIGAGSRKADGSRLDGVTTDASGIPEFRRRRLLGRYGNASPALLAAAHDGELVEIPGTPTLWAELRHAARHEHVVHLDDLLLRRVRIGLCLPDGAAEHLVEIRGITQGELGWDDARWAAEEKAYRALWKRCYGPVG